MSRHPYTYSCDLIRIVEPMISRSQASQIRQNIALALGMDDEELAFKLSEYYQANEEAINKIIASKYVNFDSE